MQAEERERIARWLAKNPQLGRAWDAEGPTLTRDEVFEWLRWAHVEPVLYKSWQEFKQPTGKKVDPDSCRHEVGRGKHWRVKRLGRGQTSRFIERNVKCRKCGKVLRDASELDNDFMLEETYIGPQTRVDEDGEEYERYLSLPRFDFDTLGDTSTVEVLGLLRRETKVAYEKLLAAMPATAATFDLSYPDDSLGPREWEQERSLDGGRWKQLGPSILSNVPGCQTESFLHNVRSLYELRVVLQLWQIEPNCLDDRLATYNVINPPEKWHRAGIPWIEIQCPRHHDGAGWGVKVTADKLRTRFTHCRARSECPGFIVGRDDGDIRIRQYNASGDTVRALRVAGYKVKEISEKTGIPVRTVERKLEGLILREEVCDTSDTTFP